MFATAVRNSDTVKANEIFDKLSEDERRRAANESIRSLHPIHHLIDDQPSSLSLLSKMIGYTDINARDGHLATPLLNAIRLVRPETVRLLIYAGAYINLPDSDGVLPIISALNSSPEIFEMILLKKPSLDQRTLKPAEACGICRSSYGHSVHCFIYGTDNPRIARLAFDYIVDSHHPFDPITATRYFQLFASHGDIPYLERILSKYKIDPSNYIFKKQRRTFITDRDTLIFLASRKLFTKEYVDWNIREAAMSNDVESVLIHIACGATRRSIKIENMILRSNATDILTILIATIGLDDIPSDDIDEIVAMSKNSEYRLASSPDNMTQLISTICYVPSYISKHFHTVGDIHRVRIQTTMDIMRVLRISSLWRDGDLPNLFDMIDFEIQKMEWRRRVDDWNKILFD